MRFGRLPYITLWAVEFEKIKTLYKKTLGLLVIEENQNFIMFDTRGSRLAFHKLVKAPRLERQTAEIHFEVENVDEVYTSLQRQGIKFEEKPANKPWGIRMASFRDPEGYTVEIIGPTSDDQFPGKKQSSVTAMKAASPQPLTTQIRHEH